MTIKLDQIVQKLLGSVVLFSPERWCREASRPSMRRSPRSWRVRWPRSRAQMWPRSRRHGGSRGRDDQGVARGGPACAL